MATTSPASSPSARELPTPRPIKWRVALAHDKHKHDLDSRRPPARPTLADQFNELPGELREHIFALLLVQPSQWDMPHNPDCPLLLPRNAIYNHLEPEKYLEPETTCAKCDSHYRNWRSHQPIWRNPWRSTWAPPQQNPYICTICYDESFRPDKPPKPIIPCLCARRQNLQTLLVCRKWHAEASQVFYTRNTFCFACPKTFAAYMAFLPAARKAQIRRVSLMAYIERSNVATADRIDFYPFTYAKIFKHLRNLPNLAFLELDSLFLTSNYSLQPLRRLGLRQLRQCRFVQRLPDICIPRPDTFFFPALARRALVKRFLAAEVAAEIKGQHGTWSRGGKKSVEMYIDWENEDRGWHDTAPEGCLELADGKAWWQGEMGDGMFVLTDTEQAERRRRERSL
ncbi:hypothetical protein B0A48_02024 [Cryoendolithus antarcticus]|uniref:F-box domain-containing protein n=1 Tax=Cryoendolithus antarcticus TaxID=1507870 RepID=A0A1V8TMX1_9PEZI|nr:hypothetical protein B0A48_02024 [Cryoendolithus antarcticus]